MYSITVQMLSRHSDTFLGQMRALDTQKKLIQPSLPWFVESPHQGFCKFLWISLLSNTSTWGHYFPVLTFFIFGLHVIAPWGNSSLYFNFINTHTRTHTFMSGGYFNTCFGDKRTFMNHKQLVIQHQVVPFLTPFQSPEQPAGHIAKMSFVLLVHSLSPHPLGVFRAFSISDAKQVKPTTGTVSLTCPFSPLLSPGAHKDILS